MARFARCIALVALAVGSFAQVQQPTSKFSARAELVTVPVVVTRNHHFVPGLKQEDFTILEDGKPKQAAFFQEVTAEPAQLQHATAEPGTYTNMIRGAEHPTAVVVVLFNGFFSEIPQFHNARQEFIKFLSETAQQKQPVMVTTVSYYGLQVVHDFTTSRDVLLAALNKVRALPKFPTPTRAEIDAAIAGVSHPLGDPRASRAAAGGLANPIDVTREANTLSELMGLGSDPMTRASQFLSQLNIDSSLNAIEQLAYGLRGVPGRKSLIMVGGSPGCPPLSQWVRNVHGEVRAGGEYCEDLWRELAAANMAVYVVNVMPTENPTYTSAEYQLPRQSYASAVQSDLAALSFAQYTGGTICSYRNDLDTCFRRAVDDSSHYYLLSYYATPTEQPVWRKIQVKVKGDKLSVRARNGYLTAGTQETSDQRRKAEVASAVVSPIEYTGVPLSVRWLGVQPDGEKQKYAFVIRVAPGQLTIDEADRNHIKLNVIAVALSPELQTVADIVQDVDGHLKPASAATANDSGFVYTNALVAPPGRYWVKFIVRDELSGRLGSVTAPLPQMDTPSGRKP